MRIGFLLAPAAAAFGAFALWTNFTPSLALLPAAAVGIGGTALTKTLLVRIERTVVRVIRFSISLGVGHGVLTHLYFDTQGLMKLMER
jgi:hypothetical protein